MLGLAEAIDEKFHVNSLERIVYRKYSREDREKYEIVETKNILIKFKGRGVPQLISLYRGLVKLKVRPYIPPVRQCYKCYGYGHTKNFCKREAKMCCMR